MTTKRFDSRGVVEYIRTTVADITYYVTTTGSDTNDGLTVPTALLTIQEAINRVPKIVKHKVTIEVGAGNFGAFRVSGFSLSTWVGDGTDYQFTIRGAAFTAWTPATGLGSGTSTGGTTNTLIDAGGGWTAHNLRGKWVYVNSEWLIIRDNDATSFETIGISGSTMSGKAYVIQDHSTFINTKVTYATPGVPGAYTAAVSSCVWLDNNLSDLQYSSNGIHVTRMQVVSPATTTVSIHSVTSNTCISYVSVIGTYTTGYVLYWTTHTLIFSCYCGGTGVGGIQIAGVTRAYAKNLFCYGLGSNGGVLFAKCIDIRSGTSYLYGDYCTGSGVFFEDGVAGTASDIYGSYNSAAGVEIYTHQYLFITNITSNNNKYGMVVNVSSPITTNAAFRGEMKMMLAGTVVMNNNTDQGLVIGAGCGMRCTTLTGTGNGGYGIYAKLGAKAFITSGTTITGSLGDVKVSNTVGSYAIDFATDQSSIVNVIDGTLIERSDTIVF